MILSFYRSKSHSFQNPKKTGFSGFPFSATRNPGFKILPRIENTSTESALSNPHKNFFLIPCLPHPKFNLRPLHTCTHNSVGYHNHPKCRYLQPHPMQNSNKHTVWRVACQLPQFSHDERYFLPCCWWMGWFTLFSGERLLETSKSLLLAQFKDFTSLFFDFIDKSHALGEWQIGHCAC